MNQRVALIDMELEGLLQLINPVIKSYSDEEITDLEGSVSLPNVFGEVTRSKMIVLQCNDVNGNQVELTAYDDVARMILYGRSFKWYPFTDKANRILNEDEVEAYFENE